MHAEEDKGRRRRRRRVPQRRHRHQEARSMTAASIGVIYTLCQMYFTGENVAQLERDSMNIENKIYLKTFWVKCCIYIFEQSPDHFLI